MMVTIGHVTRIDWGLDDIFGKEEIRKFQVGDKVIYSPYLGCDENIKTVHTVTRASEFFPNMWGFMVMLEWKSGLICSENCDPFEDPKKQSFEVGDVVYYKAVEWAEPERGVVSSLCEDPNFVFVRFKAVNGERTPVEHLTK